MYDHYCGIDGEGLPVVAASLLFRSWWWLVENAGMNQTERYTILDCDASQWFSSSNVGSLGFAFLCLSWSALCSANGMRLVVQRLLTTDGTSLTPSC